MEKLDVTVYSQPLKKAELEEQGKEFALSLEKSSKLNVAELYVAFKRLVVFAESGVKALQDKAKEFSKNLTEGKGTVTISGAKVIYSPGNPIYDFSEFDEWKSVSEELKEVRDQMDTEIAKVKDKYDGRISELENRLKNIENTLMSGEILNAETGEYEKVDLKPVKYKADIFRVTL